MKLIKVAAAVLNQTPRDWEGNYCNIIEAIRLAKKQNVSVLCLPEMCITGYGLEDDLFCADIPKRAMKYLLDIATECKDIIVSVGLPIVFNNTLYNAVATIVNGNVVGFTCKQHLAGDGIHYEPRHFKAWPQGVVQTYRIEGHPNPFSKEAISLNETFGLVPIGDIHFSIGGVKIGYEICEDAWVANRPASILASKGVDIYLNPSASHFSFGKINTRKNFVVDGSRAFNATYVYANLVGNEAGRAIYDGGAMVATNGNLVAIGKQFTYKNALLTTAVVDVDNTKTSQVRSASFQPDLEKYNEGCVGVIFNFPEVTEKASEPISDLDLFQMHFLNKHEECTHALGLALMDYMRKSHTKGFVVSLSGGADSAMVTYACVAGIKLGIAELGFDLFVEKYCPHLNTNYDNSKELISKLVTTAYQATENSGEVTRNAAKCVATELGVKHFELDVQPIFAAYKELGKIIKGSALNFDENDVTLQNLQARVRSPGIWIVANMEGKLLLTTSNMSEAAVGYATMDGDTSGCIAPIAGLPKMYIREYLRHLGATGQCKSMEYINNQQPTAELRPAIYKQTDEDDLMPYWLLHKIESLVVRNRYTPLEVYQYLKANVDYDNNRLIKDITKFFRLFSINQWKRERYALSFHMDDHNLDPRSWCRTPILTGGYAEELKELDKYITK